jgi:hypothetical protein
MSQSDKARRGYGQREQSKRRRVLADRGCHHQRARDQADCECSQHAERKALRMLTGEKADRHDRQQMARDEKLRQPAEEGGHA